MGRRRPVVVDDYAHWDNAIAWGVEMGLKSVEAVPLLVGDRSVGVMIVRVGEGGCGSGR